MKKGVFTLPDPADYPQGRLFCLDLVRGLDIIYLTAFIMLCLSVGSVFHIPNAEASWFRHQLTSFVTPDAPLYGFNLHDFAQPLFIFICGAAVPFAIPKRLTADGRATAAFWKHVLARVALLWGCGILLHNPMSFDLQVCRPFSDTLQTIALAYLGASLAQLVRRHGVRLALAFAAIAAVGVLHAVGGDYTCFGNIARRIDIRIFTSWGCKSGNFCYILTIPVWLAMGVFGAEAGTILKSAVSAWAKASRLALWGVALLALGCVVRFVCGVPFIRHMYTASFTFATLGLAFLVVDAAFVLTDIWKLRRGTGLLLLFGQNSLAAWMVSHFFGKEVHDFAMRFTKGFPRLIGTEAYQPVFVAAIYALTVIAAVLVWNGTKVKGR